jgi:hypothetical protein
MTLSRSICLIPFSFVCFAAGQAFSQTAPNLNALDGCWSAKITKEAPLVWTTELLGEKEQGECKVTVNEDWFVCLTQDSDGNLKGEMTNNHNRSIDGTGGPLCSSLSVALSMASPVYRCTIASKEGAKAEVVFDRCQFGQCPESDRQTVSAPITQEGGGWSIKLRDGKIVTFEKYKKPADSK